MKIFNRNFCLPFIFIIILITVNIFCADKSDTHTGDTEKITADKLSADGKFSANNISTTDSASINLTGEKSGKQQYNPLVVTAKGNPEILNFTVSDKGRRREIPIRIYLPAKKSAAPVVLFSHGLGGSREGSSFLGKHWASRGYAAVYLQHPGSDTSVWQGKAPGKRMSAMREAADLKNFILRTEDVSIVLDQLEIWNKADYHELKGKLDLSRIGMSGHSFGAITTQAVSGQIFEYDRVSFTEKRIKAAIAFSPSIPQRMEPKEAFGKVAIPWMLMTGTNDISKIGNATVENRLSVFPALPDGGKYELVLYGAEHSAFTDITLPGDKKIRNPNHHKAILALSTAFWDAYLCGNNEAKAWLNNRGDTEGPRSVLEKNDRWQIK